MAKTSWVIGVSAGPDSMALLDIIHKKYKDIVVVHVNYHKRPSAMRDQKIVESYCREAKIPCIVYDAPESPTGNFQAFARDFRFNAFKEVVQAYEAKGVFLAHHKDDDLETIVFELLSKRTPEYLGIKKRQSMDGLLIRRPLLNITKAQLIDYCEQNQVVYGIDETNMTLTYKRNQIRQVLRQMSPEDKETLFQYRVIYNKRSRLIRRKVRSFVKDDFLALNQYRLQPLLIRLQIIRQFLTKQGIDVYKKSNDYLKTLDVSLLNRKTQTISLNDEQMLVIQYGKARITSSYSYDFKVKFDKICYTTHKMFSTRRTGPNTSAVTLSESDFPITIRNARRGDAIQMRYGTKKVSRFFIDRKVPLEERNVWPVVENARGDVILVVGLGCDVYHYSPKPNLYVLK